MSNLVVGDVALFQSLLLPLWWYDLNYNVGIVEHCYFFIYMMNYHCHSIV